MTLQTDVFKLCLTIKTFFQHFSKKKEKSSLFHILKINIMLLVLQTLFKAHLGTRTNLTSHFVRCFHRTTS